MSDFIVGHRFCQVLHVKLDKGRVGERPQGIFDVFIGTPEGRAEAQQKLRHWQQDTDLAGLRDKDAVDKLPEAERADCRKLWEDVTALVKKTEAKKE